MLLDLSAMRTFSGEEHYKLKEHLAETAEVLNPFPRTILAEGDLDIARAGFDDEGRVKNIPPRIKPKLMSEDFTPRLRSDVRELSVSFHRTAMKIKPH